MNKMKYTKEMVEYIRSIAPGMYRQDICDLVNAKFNIDLTSLKLKSIFRRYGFNSGLKSYKSGDNSKFPNNGTFKKGHKPVNTKPIGTEYVRTDGYMYVKINDNPGPHNIAKRWIQKSRKVYEEHTGIKVKPKDRILHLDGNNLNDNFDNLYLVDEAIMIQLNTRGLISKYKEITEANVNVIKLMKLIKELEE